MGVWRFVRYWLYIGHRWLGIVTCLLFVAWFVSGLVMSYVGYPELKAGQRLEGLPRIDWGAVRVAPDEALSTLSLTHYPREMRIEMLTDEPVYRITDWDGTRHTVSARDQRRLEVATPEQAAAVAAYFSGARPRQQETIERDQWTVPERYRLLRPLNKVHMDDRAGTVVYVSARTGEVVLATTRWQRFWNWLGSVPHWIYFTELRANQPLWRQVNLWVSGPAILIAVSGIWIGILRIRLQRRYPHGTMSPYHGWKLWHHWAGLVGGAFLLTWILSGWLSVNPNQWLSGGSPSREQLLDYSGHSQSSFDSQWSAIERNALAGAKQLQFIHFAGQPLLLVIRGEHYRGLLDAHTGEPTTLSDEAVAVAARRLMPANSAIEQQRLVEGDSYWYSHHEQRPLPVLRVTFDDPEHSSFYLDPVTGAVLDFVDDGARRYRWWFNALHRLDFAWLLQYRALWHATIWVFCIAGLVSSCSAVVIGWRRLRRKMPHAVAAQVAGQGAKITSHIRKG